MAFIFSLCLVLVVTLYGVCQAQCVIRTLVPMTMMDSLSSGYCAEDGNSATSAEDLNALLLLARALEMDRANADHNGVDVNGLLKNLIDALAYTATLNAGRSQTEWPGYIPKFSQSSKMPTGQAPSGKSIHGNNMHIGPFTTDTKSGTTDGHTSPTAGKSKYGNDPLVGVDLLGSNDSSVADVSLAGNDVLSIGLNNNGDKSGSSGLLGGLLDSLL